MARKRLAVQFGLGTSIRSRDYTQAAARAIRDALWHNSLNVADAFGFPREAMQIDVELGVPCPEAVDCAALLPIFPYGQVTIRVSRGGLEVAKPDGSSSSVMVNAALIVYFDMEQAHD